MTVKIGAGMNSVIFDPKITEKKWLEELIGQLFRRE